MRLSDSLRLSRILPLAIAAAVIPGCQHVTKPGSASDSATGCTIASVDIHCLLKAADQSFAEISDDADWISAAGEYSVALATDGQKDKAKSYLLQAAKRVVRLDSTAAKVSAAADLGKAAATAKLPDIALSMVALGKKEAADLDDNAKKFDLLGKLAAVRASADEMDAAIETVLSFPMTTDNHAAFKARSLREISVAQAEMGDLDGAEETLKRVTFGLTYYQSTVRSDVAALAFAAGDSERARRLLQEAETIGRAQDNGYFVAGALRDIGVAYIDGAMPETAMSLFADAMAGARKAKTNQERARAMSRIGTGLADCGLYEEARMVFSEAQTFAKNAKSEAFKHFSNYEIAGSAAFAGDFATANKLVASLPATKFGSTSSLKAATQRDIAWGLTKHGRVVDARALINSIGPARERIMSYSRVVRLLKNPKMQAFPRYL